MVSSCHHAWLEVTGVTGWDTDKLDKLKQHLRQKMDGEKVEGYEQRGG